MLLLDASGKVIAVSESAHSAHLDADYSTSAVYQQAVQSGEAMVYLAQQQASAFYFARQTMHGGTSAVVVIQVSPEQVLSALGGLGRTSAREHIALVDPNGVIVLAHDPSWTSRQVSHSDVSSPPASDTGSARFLLEIERQLPTIGSLVHFKEDPTSRFLATTVPVGPQGWHLLLLTGTESVQGEAMAAAIAAALAASLLGLFLIQWSKYRMSVESQRATHELLQQAHDEFGKRVRQRTQELSLANDELRREVRERKKTVAALRTTMEELVQAGKLSTLGQMAMGMTHEINQPLTALRTMCDNTRLLLGRGRYDEAHDNLLEMVQLTDRIGRITAQLKTFGRKGPSAPSAVPLQQAISNALLILTSRLGPSGIEVCVDVPGSLKVWADQSRLEQVLVNLLGNAIDACEDWTGEKLILISCENCIPSNSAEGSSMERALIVIQDSGPGISAHVRERLFEPFLTTKPSGQGLGLGLVISASIVKEFGGTLRMRDIARGAAFEFDLKVASPVSEIASGPPASE